MSGERKAAAPAPGPSGDCDHLAQELRELKVRTGLSLVALAGRTPYSKSSWERYLNGKKPVPRQAVEALCAVAGEPCARLLALWELADTEWSGRSGPRPGAGPGSGPASGPGSGPGSVTSPVVPAPVPAPDPVPAPTSSSVRTVRRKRWRPYVLLAVGAVVGAAVVAIGVVAVGAGNPRAGTGGGEPTRRPTGAAGVEAGCLGVQCEGRTPMGMGCGQQGAATSLVDRYAKEGQRLEIRYSEVCRSMWVRASHLKVGDEVALYPALKDAGGTPAESGEADENGGRVMRAKAVDVGDATGWVVTAMTAPRDPSGARVCLEPVTGGTPECFGK